MVEGNVDGGNDNNDTDQPIRQIKKDLGIPVDVSIIKIK